MGTELQKAAMEYSRMGYAVLPLMPRGKTPLTRTGLKEASADPAVVRGWWERWPDANIGLATGMINSLLVIDLDVDDDRGINGFESLRAWQREHGRLPDTWLSITGRGGYHMFYHCTERHRNRVGVIEGVDIRAEGGYVVAPPSVHPNGNTYVWEQSPDDTSLADADTAVEALLSQEADPRGGRAPGPLTLTGKVPEGKRNDTMFRIACSLQAKGLSDSAILAACREENRTRFEPPLGDEELRRTVASCTGRFAKGEPASAGSPAQRRRGPDFERDERGALRQTIWNAEEAIEHDPMLSGKIRYNEFSYSPYVTGSLPWDPVDGQLREWSNFDDTALRSYIEAKYGLGSLQKCMDALDNVVARNRFNPVQDMLRDIHSRRWDGQTEHIARLLPKYLGADDTRYTREVMRLFMLGAISRAFRPGCKFDYMMVLVGKQGIGKSAFLRFLSMNNAWFNDNFNTVEGDKASEKLRGMWMVELAELLAAKKVKEQESIKAFLTSTFDTYRAPYGRRTEQRPRMCVFAGTTNTWLFLADPTGARRFLPVETSAEKRERGIFDDTGELERDIANAWGEAMDIWLKAGDSLQLKLPEDLEETAASLQVMHTEDDPRVGLIQQYADRCRDDRICAAQLFTQALSHDMKDLTRRDIADIHQIMGNQIRGWRRSPAKQRCGTFGTQLCYVREDGVKRLEEDPDEENPFL